MFPCTQGDLAELSTSADEKMREEGGWCRKLDGRNQTPVAQCRRQTWSEVPVSKGSVSAVFSNSSCCILTLNTLFCLFRHAKPCPDKSKPCTVCNPDCCPHGGETNDSLGSTTYHCNLLQRYGFDSYLHMNNLVAQGWNCTHRLDQMANHIHNGEVDDCPVNKANSSD